MTANYKVIGNTIADQASMRDRLYAAYASQHAGYSGGESARLNYRRHIRPALPPPDTGPVLDIGCGQGELVRLMINDGYDAEGVDISPEQVAIAHAAGVAEVRQGDYRTRLNALHRRLAAVTATDILEHLDKTEVLETFDLVAAALAPNGVFVARVPNAVSPFGGHIRYGDFTHESWYTARSVRQLAAAAGFTSVAVLPCSPLAHGIVSSIRVVVWAISSLLCKLVLAAETGTLRGHIVTQNLIFVARKDGIQSRDIKPSRTFNV
ncbi:MAG: class I SAM-dependent DNA methyltransferase [Streptosporangiaceae bacterium]